MQLNQRFSYPKWEKQVTVSCRVILQIIFRFCLVFTLHKKKCAFTLRTTLSGSENSILHVLFSLVEENLFFRKKENQPTFRSGIPSLIFPSQNI